MVIDICIVFYVSDITEYLPALIFCEAPHKITCEKQSY